MLFLLVKRGVLQLISENIIEFTNPLSKNQWPRLSSTVQAGHGGTMPGRIQIDEIDVVGLLHVFKSCSSG